MIFNFGSAKVCSPAVFDICFSFDKDTWIASTEYYMYFLHNCAISIDNVNLQYILHLINFYIIIIFSFLINVFILLLNCWFNTSSLHTFSFS